MPIEHNCIFCGEKKFKFLTAVKFDRLEGEFSFYRCISCGLVFTYPLPSRSDLNKIYSNEYFKSPNVSSGYRDYLAYNARGMRKKGADCARRLIKEYRPTGRLLDIGCSTGHFLKGVAENCKWEVFGIEVSEWAVNYAVSELGLDVKLGTLEDVNFPDKYFDIICLDDVLEHTLDPVRCLRGINRILKDDGEIFITLPQGKMDLNYFLTESKKRKIPVSYSFHLFFFEIKTLKNILKETGFEISRLRYVNFIEGLRDIGLLNRTRFIFNCENGRWVAPKRPFFVPERLYNYFKIQKFKFFGVIEKFFYSLRIPFGHNLNLKLKKINKTA